MQSFQSGPLRRISLLVLAGLLAATIRLIMRHAPGGNAGEVAEGIWFCSGELPLFRPIARAALSIVIVGMGASLAREVTSPGAAIDSALSLGASPERRLARRLPTFAPSRGLTRSTEGMGRGCGALVFAALCALWCEIPMLEAQQRRRH